MKVIIAAILFACLSAIIFVDADLQKTDSQLSISYGAFPCTWTGEVHVSRFDSLVYQCVNVRGRAAVDYIMTPVPNTQDQFSVTILNSTEYQHWSNSAPFKCINHPQCLLKDGSLKKGSLMLDLHGDDLFLIITDQNRLERAFVTTAVRVYNP